MFNRGQTRPELFPDVEKLRGDRDGDLAALARRRVRRGRRHERVRPAHRRARRSTRSATSGTTRSSRRSPSTPTLSTPPTESSPVAELTEPTEEWREAYGELKADCEDVVRERFPDAFVPRPGLIVGPWDPTGRFTYWPQRFADGGRVLAPAPPDADAQVIDARDLAAWIVRAAEQGPRGHVQRGRPAGTTRETLIETCRRVAGVDAEVVWVDGAFLAEHEVGEWMELPLWLIDPAFAGMLSVDPSAALAAGLEPRPLEETVRDTLAWIEAGDAPTETTAGLDRTKEQAVLDAWLSKR